MIQSQQAHVPSLDYRMKMFIRLTALRMIQVTVTDLMSSDIDRQLFASMFFRSDGFSSACEWANLEPNRTRARIEQRVSRSRQ